MLDHVKLGFALRLKAKKLPAKDANLVKEGLKLRNRVAFLTPLAEVVHRGLLKQHGKKAVQKAIGDGTILQMIIDFLNLHWEDIWPLIVQLIEALLGSL